MSTGAVESAEPEPPEFEIPFEARRRECCQAIIRYVYEGVEFVPEILDFFDYHDPLTLDNLLTSLQRKIKADNRSRALESTTSENTFNTPRKRIEYLLSIYAPY